MKNIIYFLFYLLIISCSNNTVIEFTDTIDCNPDVISNTIITWNKKQITDKQCYNNIINQFNSDSDSHYNNTRNTIIYSNSFKGPIDSCQFNNNYLKQILKSYKIEFDRNKTVKKKLIIEKENSQIYSTTIYLNFIKISNGSNSTWVLANICHKDVYQNNEGISDIYFRYKYNIENNEISSTLNCWIEVEIPNSRVDIGIELENIKVENGKLMNTDTFLTNQLKIMNEEYKKYGLKIKFE